MPDWLTAAAPYVAIFGGVVGLIGGSLGIYYASTANAALLKRLEREDEDREIAAAKDELERQAYLQAKSVGSASTIYEVGIQLQTELQRRACWQLVKDGRAGMREDACFIAVDTLPEAFRRDMNRRGT